MTREEALRQADDTLTELVRSGDPAIMEAATVNGRVDQGRLALAMLRARQRLADKIQAEAETIMEEGRS